MGLYKKLSEDINTVDVIIAGGGTAACIVAARLAEADPNLSILVIEHGPDNYGNPQITKPSLWLSNILPGSETTLVYEEKAAVELGGRPVPVHTGRVLGGGSSVNIMAYVRGQRDDFDSWETPGWTADEVLPFLNKLETHHGWTKDEKRHGYKGPIQVSSGTLRVKRVEDALLKAAGKIGWPEVPDLQTLDHNNIGVARHLRFVTPDGERSDAAHSYLHPRLRDGKHPNLHVVVESGVIRVLFDKEKRATGVEYQSNDKSVKRTINARKLVVVASGACGTPSVLERSGIGRPDVLKKAGVPLLVDLPGVGHDYQDHHTITYPFYSSLEPHETLDEFAQGRLTLEEAAKRNDPRLGWNGVDIGGKVRPTDAEVEALGPEFKALWDRDYRNKPNRPLVFVSILNGTLIPPGAIKQGQYISPSYHTAYPLSRGHFHITGPGLDDPIDFSTGFMSGEGAIDIKSQIWAYKRGRELMRRVPMYRGEVEGFHPAFNPKSQAALVTLTAELDTSSIKDLVYTAEDDQAIDLFIRQRVKTTWHSMGTAKMAPREKNGVVDKDLNVYGVKGLKVVDFSISPKNVAANTNATALLIGEKGADIIMRELKLI